jgi:hypothetical protein
MVPCSCNEYSNYNRWFHVPAMSTVTTIDAFRVSFCPVIQKKQTVLFSKKNETAVILHTLKRMLLFSYAGSNKQVT